MGGGGRIEAAESYRTPAWVTVSDAPSARVCVKERERKGEEKLLSVLV